MNRDTYRLVFNRERGAWMAAAEFVRSHGRGRTGGAGKARAARRRLAFALLAAAALDAAAAPRLPAGTAPVPVNNGGAGFVSRGAATYAAPVPTATGNALTITQTSQKAVLNWNSFNVAAGSSVRFSHPNASAATLNRIGGADPSVIQGMITSTARDTGGTGGTVYLLNRNGILFDKGAQVNVGGLVASALDIADDTFMNGLLSGTQGTATSVAAPAFTWGGSAEQFQTSYVRVEAGADINTSQEGRVMLLAPTVQNFGNIATPQGQTILAAGAKVYLASPVSGSKLRGFLVEVDPYVGTDAGGNPVTLAGSITNRQSSVADLATDAAEINERLRANGAIDATDLSAEQLHERVGRIVAERGNITLAALAVNQQGLLKATTSVDLNGSIYLQARDRVIPGIEETASDGTEVRNPLASRMGVLSFAAGSVTEVAPDTANTRTLRDDQTFNKSEVRGAGKTIVVEDNAAIVARAGEVSLTAQGDIADAGDLFGLNPDGASRVHLAAGSRIDVSGLRDVALSVERNVIEVELRGNELKDSPMQRDGVLAGEKVLIDIRAGTTLGDVSGYIAGVQRGIAEKSSAGGNIVLKAEGDVVVRKDSSLDVSGGSIAYAAGDTGTTKLVADGRSFGIATASAERTYTSFVKDTYRYEAGYLEGSNAGAVAIYGDKVVLDGSLAGGTIAGVHQRDVTKRPQGGKLTVGRWALADDGISAVLAGMASAVRFAEGGSGLPERFGVGDALPDTMNLDSGIFATGGFTRLQLVSANRVDLPSDIRLVTGPGGELSITGRRIDVQGSLATPGGSIALTTLADPSSVDPADFALTLGGTARLSTAGAWVSDMAALRSGDGSDTVVLKGGSVSLKSAAGLSLAAGSLVDVSGGGWLQGSGKYMFGDAGTITLTTGTLTAAARPDASMTLGGSLAGYGLSNGVTAGKGGSLNITASNVSLGGSALGDAGELHLDESFFSQGGFRSHSITGRDQLSVAAGASIRPAPVSRLVGMTRSGGSPAWEWTTSLLPELIRSAGSLKLATLSSDFGNLTVGTGAHLAVDPGGSIALTAGKSIHVDGALEAAGGGIALTQTAPTITENYLAERAIWLGANARLLAQGYARLLPNVLGQRQGSVLDGGSIVINASKAYLVTESLSAEAKARGEAMFDVSGATATLDFVDTSGGRSVRAARQIGSDGGTISLAAREGMLLDGNMKATGGSGALGGALVVTFDRGSTSWTTYDPDLAAQLGGSRRLVLTQSHDAGTGGMTFGQAIDTATRNGLATIAVDTIEAGGFADVTLTSQNSIELDGTLNLTAQKAIHLDAPNLQATGNAAATLNAGLVSLGNSNTRRQGEAFRDDASTGTGTLTANAKYIALEGTLTQQGFATTTLNSQGDVAMRGVVTQKTVFDADGNGVTVTDYKGAFISGGDIAINAARIYPSTLTDFAVEIHNNAAGTIDIGHLEGQSGGGGALLSASGRLAFAAPNIRQGGTIKAPFGAIELRSERVTRIKSIPSVDGPSTGINVDPITSDDFINTAEVGDVVPVTGTVGGDAAPGDTVSFTVNGTPYSGAVQPNKTWRIEVAGADLAVDAIFNAKVTGSAADNPFTATTTSTHRIDTRIARPAGGTVSLSDGSVTSVSGEGQAIPFGKTELSGRDWVYLLGGASRTLNLAPEKRVLLDGDSVAKSAGAVIDLSGGGDMQAWEFLPGTGGSQDVLDPAVSAKTYAIVPTLQGAYAPYDLQSWSGTSGLVGGESIALGTGVGGLAAGSYVLLPARYALLPGGYTVTFTGTLDAQAGRVQAQPDGGWQVAADRATATLGGLVRSARSELVEIASGDVARTRSEYIETTASDYFAGGNSRLPGDAGQLAVRAGTSLALGGSLNTGFAANHRGAEVDITANKLAVVAQAGTDHGSGYMTLATDTLNQLGAASLVLGGIRSRDENGATLTVGASDVVLDNAGAILSAQDIVLAASDTVTVAEDAAISASGGAAAEALRIAGDGALLRVSGNGLGELVRSGTTRAAGTLDVGSGATLRAAAVTLDATRESSFAGIFGTTAEGRDIVKALALGASRINLGEVPDGTAGLTLNASRLAELGAIDTLRLKSYTSIDLYGKVGAGDTLKTLQLQAGGIAGVANAGKIASLDAGNITLSNPEGIDFEAVKPAGLGSGTLNFGATETIILGSGDFKVAGFAQSNLHAGREILATGSGSHSHAGKLRLEAGRIAASSAARQKIAAAGALVTTAVAQASPFGATAAGGQLSFAGATLDHGGRIDLPAGKITLTATAGDLNLLNGSQLNAQGTAQAFADTTVLASGGQILLESRGGSVAQNAGATVDVSGASDAAGNGGHAGALSVVAAGTATLTGAIDAAAGSAAAKGGSFSLDAGSVGDLTALAGKLDSSGFSNSVAVRARSGDMALDADATLTAHDVLLAADNGNLTVAGTIDASGSKGGSIELYANRGASAGGRVTLAAGSVLKANATDLVAAGQGTAGRGGSVIVGVSATDAADELATGIQFDAAGGGRQAALIDVSTPTGSAAAAGKLIFRAPRQDAVAPLVATNGTLIVSNDTLAALLPSGYRVTPTTPVTSLGWGTTVSIQLPDNSTGQVTLDLNSLGSKAVRRTDGSNLADGDLVSATTGKVLVYDGNVFRISPTASSAIPATPSTTGGTGSAYTLSGTLPTAWGMVAFKAKDANALSPTFKIGSAVAKKLLKSDGTALAAGTIKKDQLVLAIYDGNDFRVSPTLPSIARVQNRAPGTTGVNFQVAEIAPAATLVPGMVVSFTAQAAAKAGAKLRVGNNDEKLLVDIYGAPLAANAFMTQQGVVAVYDGTDFRVTTTAIADSGSANTYKVSQVQAATASSFKLTGYTLTFRAKNTNSTSSTLEVTTADSTKATVDLKREDGSPLQINDIKAAQLVTAVFAANDSTAGGEFRIVGNTELATGPVTASTMAPVALAGDVRGAATVVLEGVNTTRTSGNVLLGAPQMTALATRAVQAAVTKGADFVSDADPDKRLGLVFRSGEEVRSTGNITLGNDWSLATARAAGAPAALSMRAEGDIILNGTLSDGFASAAASAALLPAQEPAQDSWSFRIVAGADTTAAAPLALKTPEQLGGGGNLALAAAKLVRTGTGTIDIAAGGDITSAADTSVIYTAGIRGLAIPTSEFASIHPSNNPSFPSNGGDLDMYAQGDISMVRGTQNIVEWLYRQGRLQADGTLGNTSNGNAGNTAWWLNFAQFRQGVGALGGGDVKVGARGDISGLSVSTPTNARLNGTANSLPDAAKFVTQGGGDIAVSAGGDILGGAFYAATGQIDIAAAGVVGSADSGVTLALGGSKVVVEAGQGVVASRIIDPFLSAQASGNITGIGLTGNTRRITYFSGYNSETSVDLTTLSGDLVLGTGTVAPPSIKLASLDGSIRLTGGGFIMAPAARGKLGLFAADSIIFDESYLTMSDAPVGALASPLTPKQVLVEAIAVGNKHGSPALHEGDPEPVRIVALNGDIKGQLESNTLVLPKRATIVAGGDITNLGVVGQNLTDTDVSRIEAGGNIVFESTRNSSGGLATNTKGTEWGGPGRLDIVAGGNIDLGSSKGVVTRGNLGNAFLAEGGAGVFMQAGASSADNAGFLAWLEQPEQSQVRELAGYTSLGRDAERAAFLTRPDAKPLLRDILYDILRGVGRAAASAGDTKDYSGGYEAIAALFPAAAGPYRGNIDMFFSQVKTEQGGGIDLMAPGGRVNAGLAVSSGLSKGASELGIVTARGGSVRAMVRDEFAVNQSRVFTLQGGDILIWSSESDIDAGKGSKTAAATPPPQIIVRGDKIILDTSNSVSGSGIGVLLGKEGVAPGAVDLIAPKGTVIAGEAGIRATGDVFIPGKVSGGDNIQAGGNKVGVPQVEVAAAPPPVPPPPADAGKAGEQALASSGAGGSREPGANSILTVEVLGVGEDEERRNN